MNSLSVTSRLFAGFMALLVLALTVLGTISTFWFVSQQSADLDQFLDSEARGMLTRLETVFRSENETREKNEADLKVELDKELRKVLEQRVNRPVPYKTTLVVLDDRGNVLVQSNKALDLSAVSDTVPPGGAILSDIRAEGPDYRVITVSYPMAQGRYGLFRIACLTSSLDGPFLTYLTSLGLVLTGCLIALSFLGLALLRQTLAPVKQMSGAVATISESTLANRIPEPPGHDEIARLAKTLNLLLSRLEADYAFQERLVGELTHQLKTPLTILRGRNELGLTVRKEVHELQALVEDNLSDIDSMVNLLNTLLELARIDSRIDRLETKPIDLRSFLEELADELSPLWESQDLKLVLEGPALVLEADEEALRQIFINLIDNACKFAPRDSSIRIRWTEPSTHEGSVISVKNDGPPIPEDEKELIFKRFFRSATQSHHNRGSGLGLSVVRSLVLVHGATVEAVNPPGGGASFEIHWRSP